MTTLSEGIGRATEAVAELPAPHALSALAAIVGVTPAEMADLLDAACAAGVVKHTPLGWEPT